MATAPSQTPVHTNKIGAIRSHCKSGSLWDGNELFDSARQRLPKTTTGRSPKEKSLLEPGLPAMNDNAVDLITSKRFAAGIKP